MTESTFQDSAAPPRVEKLEDMMVSPMDVSAFDRLEPPLRLAALHLSRAAYTGDRIAFEQGHPLHMPLISLLEDIVVLRPVLEGDLLERMTAFLKALYAHRGNHHHASTVKMMPPFDAEELGRAAKAAQALDRRPPSKGFTGLVDEAAALEDFLFDPSVAHQLTCKSPPEGLDVVQASSVSFYSGVTEEEARRFSCAHPLNSSLIRENGRIVEKVWRAGGEGVEPGLYAAVLEAVCVHIERALPVLGADQQAYFTALIHHFRSGDLEAFRDYNRLWLKAETPIDLIIGFIEQYKDPLGHRGEFEATLHVPDVERGAMMRALAAEAAAFEAEMPWDKRWSREHFECTAAQTSDLLSLGGSAAPFAYAGVNLPNETHLRETHGSRSILVGNIVRQRRALHGEALLAEFCPDRETMERARRYGAHAWDVFVALHEVVGHASGRVSPELEGEPEDHLLEHYNTMEECRADLVALWHLPGGIVRRLGLVASDEAVEEGYWSLCRNAMVTVARMESPDAEEDHDRAELLIMQYLLEDPECAGLVSREGKKYWVLRDVARARERIGRLLARMMEIKARGNYPALRALIERYAVHVDPDLHAHWRGRFQALGIPERVAFISPIFHPRLDADGRIEEVEVRWPTSYLADQLGRSALWRRLNGVRRLPQEGFSAF